MTDYYCSSVDGSDSDTGLTWALATATIDYCGSLMSLGDRMFIDSNHYETFSGDTRWPTGADGAMCEIYFVDRTGNPEPPVETDHVVGTAGTGLAFSTAYTDFSGHCYMRGIYWDQTGSTSSAYYIQVGNTDDCYLILENCTLSYHRCTASGNRCLIGGGGGSQLGSVVELINLTCHVKRSYHSIALFSGHLTFDNLAFTLEADDWPSTVFKYDEDKGENLLLECRNSDFSNMTGADLITITDDSGPWEFIFENIKLPSGAALAVDVIELHGAGSMVCRACSDGDSPEAFDLFTYEGEVHNETTIVLSGDTWIDESTGFSLEFASNATAAFFTPLWSKEASFMVPVTSTGSKTITLEFITDNVTLNDQEFWIEIDYLGNASDTLGTRDRTCKADPLDTSPITHTSSSVSWTTTGLMTPLKQKVVESITVNQVGVLRITPYLAKASTTAYLAIPSVA